MMQTDTIVEQLKLYVQLLPRIDKLVYPELPELQKEHKLNKTQIKTILITGLFNGSVMKELWEILNVTKGNLSILIDSLVNKGFVKCERQTDDRRKVRVYLTESGEDLYKQILDQTDSHVQDSKLKVNKKETEILKKMITILD
ncbi:MarR family winged helix-turn-helix transcriptional regulator [Spirochaeta isovalerica]|uniref:HTH-type transcriptional regulator MgrA n=1 Tax=Spirochaeta isovalerica TaxID=150 RepID=A0A841RAR4_9SPIO|nr:transcriptional regulator [Spirochaeta isovalerica]MBB6479522.1 DNA-binding MarR family transcriptional regulator [Spirochaeta isovalerica]